MDLRILEIASNTENHKVVKNHTHQSKNKNPLCGDEMEISLIVKDNRIARHGIPVSNHVCIVKRPLVCCLKKLKMKK